MLTIPYLYCESETEDDEATVILKKFVNNRLTRLMKEVIVNELSQIMELESGYKNLPSLDRFEETVNMDELMANKEFALIIKIKYLPSWFPIEETNKVFIGLFNLLRAKNEYVPEIVMEYILYEVIYRRVNEIESLSDYILEGLDSGKIEESTFLCLMHDQMNTAELLPEPERTKVIKHFEDILKHEEDFNDEELLRSEAINMLNDYEDLKEYIDVCFWDTDFKFLDEMTEDDLAGSEANAYMGMIDTEELTPEDMAEDGKNGLSPNGKPRYTVYPWDLEE